MNRLQQIEERLAEIRELVEAGGDVDAAALNAEISTLQEERGRIQAGVEARRALEARVAGGEFPALRSFPTGDGAAPEERSFDASSPEYRAAFFRTLSRDPQTGEMRLGELSAVEKRAWTHTTANTPNVIPAATMTRIWDLVSKRYALLKDISIDHLAGVFEFVQHTGITEGEAAVVAENAANVDMKQAFVKVQLAGKEVKAHVKLSRRMQIQSIDGFEDYLVKQMSNQMGEQMNTIVVDAIIATVVAGNKFATAAGAALADTDIKKANGALKGGVRHDVYANSQTIWNHIANVKNESGDEKFIESSIKDDPAVQGRIYGGLVKVDDTLENGVILIGDPDVIVANMNQEPEVLTNINVETFETTHGSMALFDASLGDTRGFAIITITPAA